MELVEIGRFRFAVPLERDEELIKGERVRLLKGVASTERRDKHDEEMVLSGMDFDSYLQKGHLNYDHLQGPQFILGKPLEAKIVSDGSRLKKSIQGPAFWHMCQLYDTEPGRAAWDLLKAERDDPNRQHGFSVEGAIYQTMGRKLTKTKCEDVALTPSPANEDSFAEAEEHLVKSLSYEATEGTLGGIQNIDMNQDPGARADQAIDGFRNLEDILWGNCNHHCYDKHGRFKKGARGALFHLVKCKGEDVHVAAKFVKHLSTSGII